MKILILLLFPILLYSKGPYLATQIYTDTNVVEDGIKFYGEKDIVQKMKSFYIHLSYDDDVTILKNLKKVKSFTEADFPIDYVGECDNDNTIYISRDTFNYRTYYKEVMVHEIYHINDWDEESVVDKTEKWCKNNLGE
jgi:hypothetical protein